MRTFVAIEIPPNIKESLKSIQDKLKKCELDAKWVDPENIHMTLKFLGNIDESKLDKIKQIIDSAALGVTPFKVSFNEFGFFPNQRKPRVFFVSTTGRELLKPIADVLENKLEPLGFEIEGRFRSHLTLARLKSPKNIENLAKEIEKVKLSQEFEVKEITFFKSTITRTGPVYEAIYKAELK